jgi:SpoVK/Ycf46/Vps4 family AAA+-type ATPase
MSSTNFNNTNNTNNNQKFNHTKKMKITFIMNYVKKGSIAIKSCLYFTKTHLAKCIQKVKKHKNFKDFIKYVALYFIKFLREYVIKKKRWFIIFFKKIVNFITNSNYRKKINKAFFKYIKKNLNIYLFKFNKWKNTSSLLIMNNIRKTIEQINIFLVKYSHILNTIYKRGFKTNLKLFMIKFKYFIQIICNILTKSIKNGYIKLVEKYNKKTNSTNPLDIINSTSYTIMTIDVYVKQALQLKNQEFLYFNQKFRLNETKTKKLRKSFYRQLPSKKEYIYLLKYFKNNKLYKNKNFYISFISFFFQMSIYYNLPFWFLYLKIQNSFIILNFIRKNKMKVLHYIRATILKYMLLRDKMLINCIIILEVFFLIEPFIYTSKNTKYQKTKREIYELPFTFISSYKSDSKKLRSLDYKKKLRFDQFCKDNSIHTKTPLIKTTLNYPIKQKEKRFQSIISTISTKPKLLGYTSLENEKKTKNSFISPIIPYKTYEKQYSKNLLAKEIKFSNQNIKFGVQEIEYPFHRPDLSNTIQEIKAYLTLLSDPKSNKNKHFISRMLMRLVKYYKDYISKSEKIEITINKKIKENNKENKEENNKEIKEENKEENNKEIKEENKEESNKEIKEENKEKKKKSHQKYKRKKQKEFHQIAHKNYKTAKEFLFKQKKEDNLYISQKMKTLSLKDEQQKLEKEIEKKYQLLRAKLKNLQLKKSELQAIVNYFQNENDTLIAAEHLQNTLPLLLDLKKNLNNHVTGYTDGYSINESLIQINDPDLEKEGGGDTEEEVLKNAFKAAQILSQKSRMQEEIYEGPSFLYDKNRDILLESKTNLIDIKNILTPDASQNNVNALSFKFINDISVKSSVKSKTEEEEKKRIIIKKKLFKKLKKQKNESKESFSQMNKPKLSYLDSFRIKRKYRQKNRDLLKYHFRKENDYRNKNKIFFKFSLNKWIKRLTNRRVLRGLFWSRVPIEDSTEAVESDPIDDFDALNEATAYEESPRELYESTNKEDEETEAKIENIHSELTIKGPDEEDTPLFGIWNERFARKKGNNLLQHIYPQTIKNYEIYSDIAETQKPKRAKYSRLGAQLPKTYILPNTVSASFQQQKKKESGYFYNIFESKDSMTSTTNKNYLSNIDLSSLKQRHQIFPKNKKEKKIDIRNKYKFNRNRNNIFFSRSKKKQNRNLQKILQKIFYKFLHHEMKLKTSSKFQYKYNEEFEFSKIILNNEVLFFLVCVLLFLKKIAYVIILLKISIIIFYDMTKKAAHVIVFVSKKAVKKSLSFGDDSKYKNYNSIRQFQTLRKIYNLAGITEFEPFTIFQNLKGTLVDVVGFEDLFQELYPIFNLMSKEDILYRYDLQHFSLRKKKSESSFKRKKEKKNLHMILSGAPGTGKTHLVKSLGGELDIPVLIFSPSKYVGSLKAQIKALFRKARELAPCIVFIDEIDSVGKRRIKLKVEKGGLAQEMEYSRERDFENLTNPKTQKLDRRIETKKSRDRAQSDIYGLSAYQVFLNNAYSEYKDDKERYFKNQGEDVLFQLLLECDGISARNIGKGAHEYEKKGIVLIGATNRYEDLDPALLRPGRFSTKIEFSSPSMARRQELFLKYSDPLKFAPDFDWGFFLKFTSGWTSGDVTSLVKMSRLKASLSQSCYHTSKTFENSLNDVLGINILTDHTSDLPKDQLDLKVYMEVSRLILEYIFDDLENKEIFTRHMRGDKLEFFIKESKLYNIFQNQHFNKKDFEQKLVSSFAAKIGELYYCLHVKNEKEPYMNLSTANSDHYKFSILLILLMQKYWFFFSNSLSTSSSSFEMAVYTQKLLMKHEKIPELNFWDALYYLHSRSHYKNFEELYYYQTDEILTFLHHAARPKLWNHYFYKVVVFGEHKENLLAPFELMLLNQSFKWSTKSPLSSLGIAKNVEELQTCVLIEEALYIGLNLLEKNSHIIDFFVKKLYMVDFLRATDVRQIFKEEEFEIFS